ncbi:helix-turn-helix domain-containing protein, partial [Arthrobacter sp. OAP107]|uniref:helix-turn-helix domain-containing protein n=1 Tax=Arthrobacter sp. OAP107 TaxID=3156445 RepID=UPI0033952B38
MAFGAVLQAVRKDRSKNQSDVAGFFSPKLSIAAVSMAESGNRPPKTEAIVRAYADALELDADGLLDLWWAMQGMVMAEDREDERPRRQWWRERWAEPQVTLDYNQADSKAKAAWTPNEDFYAPSQELFVLA